PEPIPELLQTRTWYVAMIYDTKFNPIVKTNTSTSRRSFLLKSALAAGALSPFATFGKGYDEAIDRAAKLSAPSDLKITEIKCGYLRNRRSLCGKISPNRALW